MKKYLIIFLIGFPAEVKAEIYYRVEKDGSIYFTDIKSDTSLKPFKPKKSRFVSSRHKKLILEIIKSISQKYHLEPEIIQALVEAESGYDIYAVSDKGAIGVMQLMPDIIKRYEVINPFNPYENIETGVRYFKFLLDRLGKFNLAVAAYNCGIINVLAFNDIPPFEETRNFVKKVMKIYNNLKIKNGGGYANR